MGSTVLESMTDPRPATWKVAASLPFLFIFASLVQYDWGSISWRLAAGTACAGYALYAAIRVFSHRKAPVPSHLLKSIEGAWVAANLWSIVGLMIQADDPFSLRYSVIVSCITIFGLLRGIIPSVEVETLVLH